MNKDLLIVRGGPSPFDIDIRLNGEKIEAVTGLKIELTGDSVNVQINDIELCNPQIELDIASNDYSIDIRNETKPIETHIDIMHTKCVSEGNTVSSDNNIKFDCGTIFPSQKNAIESTELQKESDEYFDHCIVKTKKITSGNRQFDDMITSLSNDVIINGKLNYNIEE